jgi:hypothetical protein
MNPENLPVPANKITIDVWLKEAEHIINMSSREMLHSSFVEDDSNYGPKRKVKLLGLTGAKGSGKKTAATAFHGAKLHSVNFPLVGSVSLFYNVDLNKCLNDNFDELMVDGKTFRERMNILREKMTEEDPNFFTRYLFQRIEKFFARDRNALVIVRDVQTDEEAKMIRAYGGMIFEIQRVRGAPRTIKKEYIDEKIKNEGSIADLKTKIQLVFASKLDQQSKEMSLKQIQIRNSLSTYFFPVLRQSFLLSDSGIDPKEFDNFQKEMEKKFNALLQVKVPKSDNLIEE